METSTLSLAGALDVELGLRAARDEAAYTSIISRAHDPLPDDAANLADLMIRLGRDRQTIGADIAGHLERHRQSEARRHYDELIGRSHAEQPGDTEALGQLAAMLSLDHAAVDADLARHRRDHERDSKIIELGPVVAALAAEVQRLEAGADFASGTLDEPLKRVANGALALGFNWLQMGKEIPSAAAALPAQYLRATGWALTQKGPRRPDAVETITVQQAITRQIDDDAGPIRGALVGWMEAHASGADTLDLPDDPDAALGALEKAAGDLQAKRDSLPRLDEPAAQLVSLACSGLAQRDPADTGILYLRAHGWIDDKPGFWRMPDGTLCVKSDGVRVQFKRDAAPLGESLFWEIETAAREAVGMPALAGA